MYSTWEVGGITYKLKLTTAAIVELEAKLGRPLVTIYGFNELEVPPVKTMALVLQGGIGYEKQISMGNVYSLIDTYFEEGHKLSDLTDVIRKLFIASGLIEDEAPAAETEDEKN